MWTRNYQNIITANAICESRGYSGTSANAFGDSYALNYMAPDGTLREICTDYASSSYYAHSTFVRRANNVADSGFVTYPGVITSQTDKISGYQEPGIVKIGFGSSATSASFEDYALKSFISNVTGKSASGAVTQNDDGTFTINYQIIISAKADITIQEIGLFVPTSYMNNSGTNGYYVLINRIILDEPVTIANGSVGNITFSITTPKITIS